MTPQKPCMLSRAARCVGRHRCRLLGKMQSWVGHRGCQVPLSLSGAGRGLPGSGGCIVSLSFVVRVWGQDIPRKGPLPRICVEGPCGPAAGLGPLPQQADRRTWSGLQLACGAACVRSKEGLVGISLRTLWREMGKSQCKREVREVPEEPREVPTGTGGQPRACGDLRGCVQGAMQGADVDLQPWGPCWSAGRVFGPQAPLPLTVMTFRGDRTPVGSPRCEVCLAK